MFTVWNELWLAQESLLNILEMEAQTGLYPVSGRGVFKLRCLISCLLDLDIIGMHINS